MPSPLVTPARHLPRPRPGAPLPQPLRAGPRARGAGGGAEGNLKSLRSLPSAPPPQAPPPGPPPPHTHCRLNLQPDNRPVLGTPQTSPNSRDFSWGPSSPIPTPTPNTRAGLDAGDPGKEEPRPPPQSHTAAGSPLYPNSQPQGHLGAAVPPRVSQPLWTLGLVLSPFLPPCWAFVGHLERMGGRAEEPR